MSESKTSSMQTSYVAAMSNKIPKYILRIELLKCEENETEVNVTGNMKSQYVIYDESDNVLYKTTQLLWQIGGELGVRNEKATNIDITRYVLTSKCSSLYFLLAFIDSTIKFKFCLL